MGRRELTALAEASRSLPNRAPDLRLLLFGRDEIGGVAEAEALGFTCADLY